MCQRFSEIVQYLCSHVSGNKDWTRIHQKEFDKMDSLDVYLEKKRKRTESISASVKKARLLAEQTKAAVNSLRSYMSPNVSLHFGKNVCCLY